MKYPLLLTILFSFFSLPAYANGQQNIFMPSLKKISLLEQKFSGRIGIYAIDINSHKIIAYRANERFPLQSTLKFMAVSALLKLNNKNTLKNKICYTKKDLISWHPVTGKYIASGMTLNSLAEAAISYSDNPAINLIMKSLGGPKSITAFAHAIGNKSFKLLHYEGNLNSNPNNKEDTATPKDMAISLQKVVLGKLLAEPQRKELIMWMRNNTTGYKRIRAGVPNGWIVADKTGSGNFGIANDIGVLWSPSCKPIVLAIYTIQDGRPSAKAREDIVAKTTHIILSAYSKIDSCFKTTNL